MRLALALQFNLSERPSFCRPTSHGALAFLADFRNAIRRPPYPRTRMSPGGDDGRRPVTLEMRAGIIPVSAHGDTGPPIESAGVSCGNCDARGSAAMLVLAEADVAPMARRHVMGRHGKKQL